MRTLTGRRTLAILTLLFLAAAPWSTTPKAFEPLTFSDATFADWITGDVRDGIDGAAFATQESAGGNPGPFLNVTNHIVSDGNSATPRFWGVALKPDAVYNPSAGAITSISGRFDQIAAVDSVAACVGLALRQGGQIYLSSPLNCAAAATWTTVTYDNLLASHFFHPLTNAAPDFSTSGLPITFGLVAYNVWGPWGPTYLDFRTYFDNFSVTLNGVEAPPIPCAYPFTKGAGTSMAHYCVSEGGTIVEIEAPSGQEHVAHGQVWEGFVVCNGATAQAWDVSTSADGFGPATVVAGPTSTTVTLRRTSAQYQLDQAFKFDSADRALTITMTVTNISGATIPDLRLARVYDPDPNNDADDDLETRTARGVWASDVDAVTLTAMTWGTTAEAAIDTGSVIACSSASAPAPSITSDASLAAVTYRLGSVKANAKKKVVFVYRVQ